MNFKIYRTNGEQWVLDIGNSRLNEYNTLKELFIDLEKILKLTLEDKDDN